MSREQPASSFQNHFNDPNLNDKFEWKKKDAYVKEKHKEGTEDMHTQAHAAALQVHSARAHGLGMACARLVE